MPVSDDTTQRLELKTSWQPSPQPVEAPSASGSAQPSVTKAPPLNPEARSLSRIPLLVLLAANLYVFVLVQVPELVVDVPYADRLSGQLRPLICRPLVLLGTPELRPPEYSGYDIAAAVALGGALLLALVVRTPWRANPILVGVPALTTAAAVAYTGQHFALDAERQSVATGLLLAVLVIGAALVSVPLAPVLEAPRWADRNAPLRFVAVLVLYAASYLAPLAVGRAAARSGLDVQPGNGWMYVAGLALGVCLWALVQLAPPIRTGRIVYGLLALAVALGPGLDLAAGIW